MSRKRSSTYLIFGTDTADKNLILERYPEPSRKVAYSGRGALMDSLIRNRFNELMDLGSSSYITVAV